MSVTSDPSRYERLWSDVQAAYAQSDIASTCLRLQEQHSRDVVLTLGAIWLGLDGISLDRHGGGAVRDALAVWRDDAILPLRHVRQAIKRHLTRSDDPVVAVDRPGLEALRDAVKQAELEAERLALRALVPLAEKHGEKADASAETVAANLQVLATPAAGEADGLAQIAASFPVAEPKAAYKAAIEAL